jgi:hypothetical protein
MLVVPPSLLIVLLPAPFVYTAILPAAIIISITLTPAG